MTRSRLPPRPVCFQKAIIVSGEYNALTGAVAGLDPQDCKSALPSLQEATAIGSDYATAAGCPTSGDVADCLRGLPADKANAIAAAGYLFGGQGTITPTLNGTTLVAPLRDELRSGRANRVPVIAGVARDENLVAYANTASQYYQFNQAQYGSSAGQIQRLYPLSNLDAPFVAWRTIAADSDAVCSTLATDADLARWMPVYGYEIDDGNAAPLFFLPTGVPNGASHVADWFIDPSAIAGGPLDPDQKVLQDEEVADVTTFARTANPSAENTLPWPEFNGGGSILSLAPGGDSEPTTASQIGLVHHCGFWNSVHSGASAVQRRSKVRHRSPAAPGATSEPPADQRRSAG